MTYYLGNERSRGVVESYRRYQQYLHEHAKDFPPGAFALGTAEWYQDPSDHRCPHDGWLENFIISEIFDCTRTRITAIQMCLLGAYQDGRIEFSYPQVFAYQIQNPCSGARLGDWLYDEFRLSEGGHVVHEIEWSGPLDRNVCRWIIEASDVQFRWIPHSLSAAH